MTISTVAPVRAWRAALDGAADLPALEPAVKAARAALDAACVYAALNGLLAAGDDRAAEFEALAFRFVVQSNPEMNEALTVAGLLRAGS